MSIRAGGWVGGMCAQWEPVLFGRTGHSIHSIGQSIKSRARHYNWKAAERCNEINERHRDKDTGRRTTRTLSTCLTMKKDETTLCSFEIRGKNRWQKDNRSAFTNNVTSNHNSTFTDNVTVYLIYWQEDLGKRKPRYYKLTITSVLHGHAYIQSFGSRPSSGWCQLLSGTNSLIVWNRRAKKKGWP